MVLDSFVLQGNSSNLAGASVEEVYQNLLSIGNLYTMYAEDMDFNVINNLHTALVKVYNGTYPLDEILEKVN